MFSTLSPLISKILGKLFIYSKPQFCNYMERRLSPLLESCCCSLTKSCPTLCYPRLSCPSPSPGVCSNSCPLSRWCCTTISSSVAPFSSCPHTFTAWRSFPVSQLFTAGSQSIGALASNLPINIQGWFPLGLTGLIYLQSKGLSWDFSSITVWKHQFFSIQLFLWFLSHIGTWLLEKTKLWL